MHFVNALSYDSFDHIHLFSSNQKVGIIVVVSTNRLEIIKAIGPTKIIYVGYGTAYAIRFEESEYAHS